MKKILLGSFLFLCSAVWATAPANAEEPTKAKQISGSQILKKIDQLSVCKDRSAKTRMILVDRKGKRLERTIQSKEKGIETRLIEFVSPADLKGTKFLSLEEGERMYLYLPALKKVRRIASHIKKSNFMGSDFTYEDLASGQFSPKWEAKLLARTTAQYTKIVGTTTLQKLTPAWSLELTPKKGVDVDYKKLLMTVETEHFIPLEVEFYDKQNKLRKALTNSDIKLIGRYWVPLQLQMQDFKNKHTTILKIEKVKFDTGLPVRIFDPRYLAR